MILTFKQVKVLEAINNYIEYHKMSPTISDIASATTKDMGISKTKKTSRGTIQPKLDVLELKGMIKRVAGKLRGITVTEKGKEFLKVLDIN
tara:strand:- start:199 stop:471 length:273 start_codon:yes stop_codon:yes gene_type:complete